MIIVEGPDGAGKTTLVQELASEIGLKIGERATKDRSRLYEVTRRDTYTALSKAVKANKKPQIWDRLFFSEMVYAPIVGGRDVEFSAKEQTFVKRVLIALECPIIMCRPPLETVEKNVLDSEQMGGVAENVRGIYNAYGSVAEGMPFITWYDYTGDLEGGGAYRSYEHIKGFIEGYIDERKQRSW